MFSCWFTANTYHRLDYAPAVKRFMTLLLVALLALPALAGMLPAGATPISPDGVELPAETASLVDPRLALMAAAPERIGELGGAPAPAGEISIIARVDGLRSEHRDFVTALDGEVVGQHDGDAFTDGVCQTRLRADQFLGRAVVFQGAFGQGADQNFQQLWIHAIRGHVTLGVIRARIIFIHDYSALLPLEQFRSNVNRVAILSDWKNCSILKSRSIS